MDIRLERLIDVPPDWIRTYLGTRGMSPDVIEWKYLDARFNRGRDRGAVWVEDDRVKGLIGMIPARLVHDGETLPFHWACDWSIESPDRNPGPGVFLFKKATQVCPRYLAIGGNVQSLKYFPRLAERTLADAATIYNIPLRLDAILEKAGRRFPILAPDHWPILSRMRVPRVGRRRRGIEVKTEEGVPSSLGPLFDAPRGTGWHPVYDWDQIDWAIGRSPVLVSASTYAPATAGPLAAVIFWHHTRTAKRWHATLWAREGAEAALESCLAEALRQMDARGGSLVTILVSRTDDDFIRVLRAQGAIPRRPEPLFVFRSDAALAGFDEPRRLSYHDRDYSVLF